MARIALTGAAGNVGQELLNGFEGHDVTPFTHSEHDDVDSELLDVTDADAVADALAGSDVVVHLAGASAPSAEWDAVVETNVRGTKHVYEAAVEHDIDRVVFASSNHAIGTYNIEDESDPETMITGHATTIHPTDPPMPDSFYGVSKASCEALGNYYAVRHDLEIVNLRIGWLMDVDKLHETQQNPETKARFARAMWLSPRDCRNVTEAAATADLKDNPATVHGISANDDRVMSLSETMHQIGYQPRDNATEALQTD